MIWHPCCVAACDAICFFFGLAAPPADAAAFGVAGGDGLPVVAAFVVAVDGKAFFAVGVVVVVVC